jgi:Peptidase family S58
MLNDINGFHVAPEHVTDALAAASGGPVPEGGVGGGTGMICHDFKGGIGTASRVLPQARGGFTVGVLVQANHGRRERFAVLGIARADRAPADRPEQMARCRNAGGAVVSPKRLRALSRFVQGSGLHRDLRGDRNLGDAAASPEEARRGGTAGSPDGAEHSAAGASRPPLGRRVWWKSDVDRPGVRAIAGRAPVCTRGLRDLRARRCVTARRSPQVT